MFHHIATSSIMTLLTRHTRSNLRLICTPLFLGFAAVLTGCSSLSNVGSGIARVNPASWITPYKADVIQGNFVSKEQVDTLKVGMLRSQVKDILGTPLLTSLFHADRWDYVFTLQRQGVASQSFKYAVFFRGDLLERFEGDAMPSEAEFIASLVNTRRLGKVPTLEATEAQLKAAEKPAAIASTTTKTAAEIGNVGNVSSTAQPTVYPPLETAKP